MLKKILVKVVQKLGYQVYKSDLVLAGSWLQQLDIKTVIDVGANKGQFMQKVHSLLPQAAIYSFEPIPDIFTILEQKATHKNIHTFNLALGNDTGEVEMNLSGIDESSSLLEMEDVHRDTFQGSAFVAKVKVQLEKLDTVMLAKDVTDNILLKIDVQGYEKDVLLGGEQMLARASVVLLESIFNPLYKGQWIFSELLAFMEERNFLFHGFADQGYAPKSRIPMYADALFVRKEDIDKLY